MGIDRDAGTVEAARSRAASRAIANVAFAVADVGDVVDAGGFDALVGRFILMHQRDPAASLAGAVRNVRPGGVVAFIESCMAAIETYHSLPRLPAYEAVIRWKCAVVGSGGDLEAGLRLPGIFRAAGLMAPRVRYEARVETGPDSPVYAYMAESVRSMLPQARALGIEGFSEADVDALAGRLREEAVAHDAVLLTWPVVAAFTVLPPTSPSKPQL